MNEPRISDPPAAAAAPPRITVVVPSHQRRVEVVELIEALARQESAPSFEVVVVVDGSTDGTARALEELAPPFPLSVVAQPRRGAAAARNAGGAQARGDILLFLDDDMEPDTGLLAAHESRHRAGADAVVGHMPVHRDSPRDFLTAGAEAWVRHRCEMLRRADPVPGELVLTGQLSVARRWFEAIGGFDEAFTRDGAYGGEDTDFGLRLVRAGARLVFAEEAVSWQRVNVAPRAYLRRYRAVGRAYVRLLRKHPGLPAHVVRVDHRPGRFDRWLGPWIYPWIEPLVAGVLAHGGRNRRLERFFFGRLRARHYWRGVREAGGYPERRPVRVLAYHAVRDPRPGSPGDRFAVSPGELRRQLRLLQRCGFQFLAPAELERLVLANGGVPRRAVLLTFDDAYADLAHGTLEILRRHEAPAAAFVVTGRIGGTNEWDDGAGAERLALCSADELRRLADHGVELGSHSRTHPALPGLATADLERELRGSADELEALGLARPGWLAYPYGLTDDAVRAGAARAGYRLAFGIERGTVTPASDPLALPRIEVRRRDRGLRFLARVVFAGGSRRRAMAGGEAGAR